MGSAVQGFADIHTSTAGVAGDTVSVTLYGVTADYAPDTADVLASLTFPCGTYLGRVEVALPAGFVIPDRGMFAQITGYTAGTPLRLNSGSPQGIAPGRSNKAGASGDAAGLLPTDLPNIYFKRTA